MTAPRLEIDLDKIHHNARTLVARLAHRGISVTGVVKATLGSVDIAEAMLTAGVERLGDSRIENIEALRRQHITAPMTLIRSPMLSQIERVVKFADVSFNTELNVIRELSLAAGRARLTHGVVLMVELGDLREGILPADLHASVRETLALPNIELKGIGTNLACRSGVVPDSKNMADLSTLADSIDADFSNELQAKLSMVSGGNSANLHWAMNCADTARVNDLRLGEAILLGCDPLERKPIEGLFADAIVLIAEVIECKDKPSLPWGEIAQNAFGQSERGVDRGHVLQSILAIGQQDTDPEGLHAPPGLQVRGASSDHLITESNSQRFGVGAEVQFQLNYSAMLRAMTSPFVSKVMKGERARRGATA